MVETPQGVGKVKQVHVLANSIRVLVEGPNEARTMVDMPVPEPVFDLSLGSQHAGMGALAEQEAEEESELPEAMLPRSVNQSADRDTVGESQPTDQMTQPAPSSRRARSRRKRR
jgi:hypothetical protein